MALLSTHKSSQVTKLLLIGEPGTGKTGGLASLVKAGYKLRIIDLDNNIHPLVQFIEREAPDKIGNVDVISLRDKQKPGGPLGMILDGPPTALMEATRLVDRWRYKDDMGKEIDLGRPAEWGADTILVIDSLSRLSRAAMFWGESIAVRGRDGKTDGRAVVGEAQRALEHFLAYVTSKDFLTNVIVSAHVKYLQMPDGSTRGHPVGPGEKLSPIIPSYFSSYAMCEAQGDKRIIKTLSSGLISLRNPAPFKMAASLPIETGLATFFETLKRN